MTATQGAIDKELLAELVPPPRPRWQVGVALVALATLLAVVILVARSGAVVPRLDVSLDHWSTGHQVTVVFRVHNDGFTDTRLDAIDANNETLQGATVVTQLPKTISGGSSTVVAVKFTAPHCADGSSGQSQEVRLRMKNALGVTMTRGVDVDALNDNWQQTVCSLSP